MNHLFCKCCLTLQSKMLAAWCSKCKTFVLPIQFFVLSMIIYWQNSVLLISDKLAHYSISKSTLILGSKTKLVFNSAEETFYFFYFGMKKKNHPFLVLHGYVHFCIWNYIFKWSQIISHFSVRKSKAADERRRSMAKQARDDYKRLSMQAIEKGSVTERAKNFGEAKRPPLPPKPKPTSSTNSNCGISRYSETY